MEIKLFNVKGIPIMLNPLLLILFMFASFDTVLSLFVSILIHELTKAYYINKFGYKCHKIVVGFLNGTSDMDIISNIKENSIILLAGTISNLILTIVSYMAFILYNNDYILHFMIINLLLFIINIIPVHSNNGHKLVVTLLTLKTTYNNATIIALYMSLTFSIIMILLSLHYSLYMVGIYFSITTYLSYRDLNK